MREWEQELHIYRLQKEPPRMTAQAYIECYLAERNGQYLSWFLHHYEHRLNEKVRALVQDYAMPGHFMDLKQACVFGILQALQHYRPEKRAPFLVYKEHYVQRAVDDYIRTMRTGFSVSNNDEYSILKKVMAIYGSTGYKNDDKTIQHIAVKVGKSPKKVRELIESGLRNMQFTDFYRSFSEEYGAEEIAHDPSSEPHRMYLRMLQKEALHEAFDRLDYREKAIVSDRLGFCPDCWSIQGTKQKTFIDLAAEHMISPTTAERIYHGALKKLRRACVDCE